MSVVEIRDIEDCFDGSFIKELLLDQEIDEHFIELLGEIGDLRYFPEFARPFFKTRVPKVAEIKGVQGNRTLRVLLYDKTGKEWLDMFVDRIGSQE